MIQIADWVEIDLMPYSRELQTMPEMWLVAAATAHAIKWALGGARWRLAIAHWSPGTFSAEMTLRWASTGTMVVVAVVAVWWDLAFGVLV